MEKLRYWNFLGEVFELEKACYKCLEIETRAASLLSRLGPYLYPYPAPAGPAGLPSSTESGQPGPADICLMGDIRRFLATLPGEIRSVTPRPPAWPLDWDPDSPQPAVQKGGRP